MMSAGFYHLVTVLYVEIYDIVIQHRSDGEMSPALTVIVKQALLLHDNAHAVKLYVQFPLRFAPDRMPRAAAAQHRALIVAIGRLRAQHNHAEGQFWTGFEMGDR